MKAIIPRYPLLNFLKYDNIIKYETIYIMLKIKCGVKKVLMFQNSASNVVPKLNLKSMQKIIVQCTKNNRIAAFLNVY